MIPRTWPFEWNPSLVCSGGLKPPNIKLPPEPSVEGRPAATFRSRHQLLKVAQTQPSSVVLQRSWFFLLSFFTAIHQSNSFLCMPWASLSHTEPSLISQSRPHSITRVGPPWSLPVILSTYQCTINLPKIQFHQIFPCAKSRLLIFYLYQIYFGYRDPPYFGTILPM